MSTKLKVSSKLLRALELNLKSPITQGILRKEGIVLPENINSFHEAKEYLMSLEHLVISTPSAPVATSPQSINIPFQFSEVEYGRASYSCNTLSSASIELSEERVRELIVEHGEDTESIVNELLEELDSDAQDNRESYDSSNFEYESHESNSTENLNLDNESQVRDLIEDFVTRIQDQVDEEYEDQNEDENEDE